MNLSITIKLTAKDGLEPQIAALFTMQAVRYKADIELAFNGRTVNAKSMTEVMSLGAEKGDLLQIQAKGEDASEAVNALIAFIQNSDS
jgi:phosphocarrier protein HPr